MTKPLKKLENKPGCALIKNQLGAALCSFPGMAAGHGMPHHPAHPPHFGQRAAATQRDPGGHPRALFLLGVALRPSTTFGFEVLA